MECEREYMEQQAERNLQSAAEELWDLYDAQRKPLGRLHRRGDPVPAGAYHLVVHVWILNSRGELFITRRAETKGWPFFWEAPGGSALAGENSLAAALREVKEESGITLLPEQGQCILRYAREDAFIDVWLFRQEVSLSEFVPQPGETIDAALASPAAIEQKMAAGEFVPLRCWKELLRAIADGNESK